LIILDSSIWIEIAIEGPLLNSLRQYIERTENIFTPTIVFYEVSKKLITNGSKGTLFEFQFTMLTTEIIPLTVDIAAESARLSLLYNLSMADAIIYTTGRLHNADIVTLDEDLKDLPGVIFIE